MFGPNAHIMQQVVNQRFHLLQLVGHPETPDEPHMATRPTRHFFVDVVKQRVDLSQCACQGLSILLMLLRMGELGGLQNLERFPVRFRVAAIVRIVVVQIEAEIVGQEFQPTGEIVHV